MSNRREWPSSRDELFLVNPDLKEQLQKIVQFHLSGKPKSTRVMNVTAFLRRVTDYGTARADSRSEKRNIALSNSISMITATAPLLLALSVVFFPQYNAGLVVRLLASSLVFLAPVLLNRLGLVVASRIILCWLPSALVYAISILDVRAGSPMSASSFVGLRLFLITIGCFPFLVFNLKRPLPLLIGVLGPMISILFFDPIFSFFGAGYLQHNPYDPLYAYNNVRALISFLAIGLSCFFLKRMVERNEQLNEKLLAELADRSEQLRRQAEDEVHQLNQQLQASLQQMSERQFILNHSQRIAKVGSWEFRIQNSFIFWSEEMYNIFGLDSGFDLRTKNLLHIMWGDESKLLIDATINLLRTGRPYDLTLRARTPVGYTKWVRVYAFPIAEGKNIVGVRGICHDVTYYREAEDLLRTSENRYRSLFEQASDFIMILDFDGNFIDANASLCNAFGYTKEELQGMKIESLIDPSQLRGEPIRYRELMQGEHVLSHRRMMRKDRTIIVVEANAKKMQADKMLVIARDVTKFREVQQQIQVSEARFRGAFEYSAIGMALVSVEGRWLKVNKELCAIVGYQEEELLSLSFQDITYPDDVAKDFEFLHLTLAGKIETYQREKRYVHKNGSLVWVNANISLIRDNEGEPLYFVSQIEDITEEKKAHEKLTVSQANLNATINNTEILIWSVDRNFKLITFNIPFYSYIKEHYGLEIKPGDRVLDPLPEEDRRGLQTRTWEQNYLRVLTGETIKVEESRFGIDFQYSLSPIIERSQIIGVSIFADNVTERKARDRELAEAHKKIGELKLMALRSVMSPHFIFNVLNSIQFFIAKNDRLNAINYLSTFSKLIRSILTHSVDNRIKLADEIELLRNYVHLEMTRFENKFRFNLAVADDVDIDGIEIPSLLIQPYVENAILHGLYNKTSPGRLEINVYEKNDAVIFEVIDNGVGREAALNLRRENFPGHKSMGIKLTEERLKLINQQHHTAFEIEDLADQNGPAGTKVTIRVTI
jgi:PAS domain S-box-containing protein